MQPSKQNSPPVESHRGFTLPPKEKAERKARAERIAQGVLDALNRATSQQKNG